ncbi:hypothetical protein QQX98_004371 [Neonectria punicea]|uniref:Aminoglycoside phosphotransferase domain-containing protein n=1 Tax=Neonectria punicea TaxID=979145 RepID=A0ABR1H9A9_9HYPO
MFAIIHATSEQSLDHALCDALLLYGLKLIIVWNQDLGPLQLSDAKGTDTEVIFINGLRPLRNSTIRRMTLNSARLPSAFAVWDGPDKKDLVAARLSVDTFNLWLPQERGDIKQACKKLTENDSLKSFDLEEFSGTGAIRVGGSFAGSGIARYYGKSANGRGAQKLRDEMRMYKSFPETVSDYYPKLLFGIEDDQGTASLGTHYVDHPNLRDLLLNMKISANEATSILQKVLNFEYGEVDLGHRQPVPANYVQDCHFHRVWERIAISAELDPDFIPFIEARWLQVNGKRLPNIPAMLWRLEQDQEATKRLQPEGVSPFIHGDLHLENILCDVKQNRFWLVDPRGYPVCDIFYDLGKLAHSYHSCYDMIHEGRHVVDFSVGDGVAKIDYKFISKHLLDVYSQLDTQMTAFIHELLQAHGEAKDVDLRIRFNEAMHFCSMMPFHINSKSNPSISHPIYAVGAGLLAEVLEKLGIDLESCVDMQDAGLARLNDMSKKQWRFAG